VRAPILKTKEVHMEVTNRTLREERAQKIKEAKALSAKGKLNQADQRKFDALMSEAEDLKTQIDQIENRGSTSRTLGGGRIGFEDRGEDPKEKEYRRAFNNYLRAGVAGLDPDDRAILYERRDMSIGGGNSLVGPGGAFLVPIGFVDKIEAALKFSGNLMKYCTILPTETGAPLPYPLSDDSQSFAEIVGEGQTVTTADVPLGNVIFGAYKYSSRMVKVSLELLQDANFDLESWLAGIFALRFARTLNNHFTVGLGVSSSMPMGIITAAAAAGNIVHAVGSSGNTGGADGTNTIGSADLLNLVHAVDPLYREDPSCKFMMHDQTRKKLGQLLDKYGRPLFPQTLVSGAPDMILGYEIALNNAMAQLQTASSSPQVSVYPVAFGPLSKYIVRRVREMSILVLRERFIDMGQLAFLAFMRMDGNLLNAAQESAQCPIALLSNSY
jgi:HK97 family phage major capsid protein